MALFKRLKKPDPEKEKQLREDIRAEGGLKKNDFLAMVLGAMIVILPVAAATLAVMCLFIWLFF
jgi:hypothetical protein